MRTWERRCHREPRDLQWCFHLPPHLRGVTSRHSPAALPRVSSHHCNHALLQRTCFVQAWLQDAEEPCDRSGDIYRDFLTQTHCEDCWFDHLTKRLQFSTIWEWGLKKHLWLKERCQLWWAYNFSGSSSSLVLKEMVKKKSIFNI